MRETPPRLPGRCRLVKVRVGDLFACPGRAHATATDLDKTKIQQSCRMRIRYLRITATTAEFRERILLVFGKLFKELVVFAAHCLTPKRLYHRVETVRPTQSGCPEGLCEDSVTFCDRCVTNYTNLSAKRDFRYWNTLMSCIQP